MVKKFLALFLKLGVDKSAGRCYAQDNKQSTDGVKGRYTMIQISVNEKTKYISTLPQSTQDTIWAELIKEVSPSDNEHHLIYEAMDGRVCDLEDTIEIHYTK